MLLIECPWCGPRDEIEFRWGGESHVTRPEPHVGDDVWGDYLFARRNPKGVALERWQHEHGCRQWFNIARNTQTQAILAVYRLGEQPPPEFRPVPGR
ncbi:MAG: sarcosine oxidase subunit delta [Rhizomicrobium sp.]